VSARASRPSLRELDERQLRRARRTVSGFARPDSAVEVIVEGRALVNFCSNDYLGLARHPAAAAAMCAAAARCGVGSGASHLVTGHGAEHERLEEELAEFTGRPRALLFSTGYMANLAAVGVLAGAGDFVLLDRLSHASLIDAALLARARFKRFAHADAADAERLLRDRADRASGARTTLVATDGVFSMDGDVAPLVSLAASARAHAAWLLVDDAHGLGVLGARGRGLVEECALTVDDVPLLVGTLGKAFGSFGAFIAGGENLLEELLQHARSYRYTTALPQPVAAATRATLAIAQRESWRRERVLALTRRFRSAAREAGITLGLSATPIQPVLLGDVSTALAASAQLFEAGFWVAAIRPPTVPPDSARLRVTLSAAHSEAQVDALVEVLSRCVRRN
jgi:8-amino-7-oxononanoate synthase